MATSTYRAKAKAHEAQYAEPAKPRDFEVCNNCRMPFRKREATIDMHDFRRHKAACFREKPLPASMGKKH